MDRERRILPVAPRLSTAPRQENDRTTARDAMASNSYFRAHKPIASLPDGHFIPSADPAVHSSDTSVSFSLQPILSFPLTMRIPLVP